MTPSTPLHRLTDWRPRLTAYLAEIAPAEFRYGCQDCALFAAGAVRAMTGHDPAAGFRGSYTDLETGLERLRRAGFRDHVAIVGTLFARCPPALAQVGDIACIKTPEGRALGIFVGETIACLNEAGLAHVQRTAADAAWTVT